MLCNSYKANESHMVFTMDVTSALHEALRGEEVKGGRGGKGSIFRDPPHHLTTNMATARGR